MRNPLSLVTLSAFLGLTHALDLPIISLPWGKYQAEVFADDDKILLFRNVRFGQEPPRFAAPSFPKLRNNTIQSPDRNTTCIQIDSKKLKHPPIGGSPLEDPHDPPNNQTEDCLFLDIYVPKWVFEEDAADTRLPVTVWIYGGGYAFGSKNQGGPLYTGKSGLQASGYNNIFIAGNHRVGAFGWLAGDYMQKAGQPNAGLYDQALLFEWVQQYIDQVRGDKESVSAWGESAGASSILHHLVREEGTVDPKFRTFAAQSPGFEWAWDNSPDGKLDTIYRNFSRLAKCEFAYDMDCLRKANVTDLAKANQELFDTVRQTGLFPVGPAVDGKWIKTLSSISFSEGKYWKEISGTIISHVANEGYLFSPKTWTVRPSLMCTSKNSYLARLWLPRGPPSRASTTARRRGLATTACAWPPLLPTPSLPAILGT
uniref:Carboxylesterase type B domain-containing protein n=1 Tax=Bionectria ochroleuca TaxID=29856 RepID=A0A8H7K2M2_BIOOC